MDPHGAEVSGEALWWVDASAKLQTDQTSAANVAHFEREVTATDQDEGMGSDKAIRLEFTSHPTDINRTMTIVCTVKVNTMRTALCVVPVPDYPLGQVGHGLWALSFLGAPLH